MANFPANKRNRVTWVKSKKTIVLMVLALLLTVTWSDAYEITKVIEVGEATWTPLLGPLKWSPDGSKLAFFNGSQLMLTDTLGNERFVKELEIVPRRFEWVSNTSLAMQFVTHTGQATSDNQLTVLDINTLEITSILEYRYNQEFKKAPGAVSFSGPFLTIEGNVYYEKHTNTGDKSRRTDSERAAFTQEKDASIKSDHVLQWSGDTALYVVKFDNSDSTLLKNTFNRRDLFAQISRNKRYISVFRALMDTETSGVVGLSDYIPKPSNTLYCDLMYRSFNPQETELLFQVVCEGPEPNAVIVNSVGIYNFESDEFSVLDTLIGLTGCTTPVYHPNGSIIALLSDGKLYIVQRGRN